MYFQNKRSSRDIETITEDLVMDGKTSGDNLSEANTKEISDQTELHKVKDNVPVKQKESTEHIENESERRSHDKKDEEVVVLRKSSRTSTGSGGQEVLIGDDLEPFAGRSTIKSCVYNVSHKRVNWLQNALFFNSFISRRKCESVLLILNSKNELRVISCYGIWPSL